MYGCIFSTVNATLNIEVNIGTVSFAMNIEIEMSFVWGDLNLRCRGN